MSSRSRLTYALVLAALAAPLPHGQQTVSPTNDLNRISGTILRGDSMELLRELTELRQSSDRLESDRLVGGRRLRAAAYAAP